MTGMAEWLNYTFAGFDYRFMEIFHNLHESASGGFFDIFFNAITFLGNDGICIIVLSLVFLFFKKTRKIGLVMIAAIAFGAIITNISVKPIVARPRPYADVSGIFHKWWVSAGSHVESEFSFPSGHTTSAMAAMTGLFCVSKKKQISWIAFSFAILMGMSRIYLCVHYPSDVLGGLIVGLVAGVLAGILINSIYKIDNGRLIPACKNFDLIDLFKSVFKKEKKEENWSAE